MPLSDRNADAVPEAHLNLDIKGLSDFCLIHSPVLDWVMSPAGTTKQSLNCDNCSG